MFPPPSHPSKTVFAGIALVLPKKAVEEKQGKENLNPKKIENLKEIKETENPKINAKKVKKINLNIR